VSDQQQEKPDPVVEFPKLRQSLLARYDNCALSTKFDLEWRNQFTSHPQARGQLFHRFAARALEEMERHKETNIEVDVGLAILHEVLRQHDIPKDEIVNLPMKEVKDLYWVVKKWCFDNSWDIQDLISVEERLEMPVTYYGEDGLVERIFTGQLDAVFADPADPSHVYVIDWKDTWSLPAKSEVSFEGYFQQRVYAALIFHNYRAVEKVTLREFYVRYSEPREATLDRWDAGEDIKNELSALIERFDRSVREDTWPPTPGKHCSYCPRPTACPIPVFGRGEGRITDAAQAEKVAGQLVVGDAVVSQAKKALRAWAEQHGSVPIKDAKGARVYGFRKSTRKPRPKKEEVERALLEGRPLDDLYQEETTSRFESHTPDPEAAKKEDEKLLAALGDSMKQARARKKAA
jgi:hypothetical protein